MILYIPKHLHFLGPAALVLFPFWVNQQFFGGGFHGDVFWFLMYPCTRIAEEWARYISGAGVAYQNYITSAPPPKHEPTSQILNWHTGKPIDDQPEDDGLQPIIRVDGKPRTAYAQTVRSVKEDKVRYVAFTLLRQKQNGFKVDLTEKRWVKGWKFSREEFLNDLIDPWKRHGVIARAGERKNAPYDVLKWDAVQLISQGEHLPRI